MTGDAGLPIEILEIAVVTIHTGDQPVIIIMLMMDETETGIGGMVKGVAIQIGGQPALGRVACFTGLREYASVYCGFFVATGAFSGCILEWISRVLRRGRERQGEIQTSGWRIILRNVSRVEVVALLASD